MKAKIKNNGRDKKFIGAAIGAVANVAGGVIGAIKKKKQAAKQKEQLAIQEQNQMAIDAQQQAAAMSSSMADQNYVNDVKSKLGYKNGGKIKGKDRIVVAKKYAMGGRSKKLFGMNDEQMAKANQAVSLFDTVGTAVTNIATGGQANIKPTTNYSDAITASNIQKNREIIRKAKMEREANKPNTTQMRYGGKGRKKALFGEILEQAGGAAGGLSGLVNSIAGPKESVQKAKLTKAGYDYGVPKTAATKSSYQLDSNGNPVTSTVTDEAATANQLSNPQFRDRLATAKMGMRKRKK